MTVLSQKEVDDHSNLHNDLNVANDYLLSVFKNLSNHPDVIEITRSFPFLAPSNVISEMRRNFLLTGRGMLFHVASLVDCVIKICACQEIQIHHKEIALLAVLYHDFVKITHEEVINTDPLLSILLDKTKFGHSAGINRIFLYLGLPELAQAVRHSSPDFHADVRSKSVTIPQLILNIADRVGNFGKKMRVDNRVYKKNSPKGFDHDSENKATALIKQIYQNILLGTPDIIGKQSFLNVSNRPKRLTIISRFDNKYHAPTENYIDTSSAVSLAYDLAKLDWDITILHRGNFETIHLSDRIRIIGVDVVGELEEVVPLIITQAKMADLIMVEGWTLAACHIARYKRSSQMLAVIFRGLNGGRLTSERINNSSVADEIWAVSRTEQDVLRRGFSQEGKSDKVIRLIPNGVNTQIFNIDRNVQRVKGKVLYVGALREEKGVNLLLQAMDIVVCECPDAKLHLIGSSQMYGDQSSIPLSGRSYVVSHGQLKHQDIAKQMQTAHLTVLLSKPDLFETFGKAIEEAKACGSPVLVSTSGALPERLDKDTVGGVVNNLTPTSVAQSIVELISDDPKPGGEYLPQYTWRLSNVEIATAFYEYLRN